MKKRTHKNDNDIYEEDPFGLGPNYTFGKVLTRKEQRALGMPTPAEFAAMLKPQKVTLALDSDAIAFFKAQGKKHGVPYQAMIRSVVRDYVARQPKNPR
jgi:predicted DNA binding CopG/RHH family protein